MSAGVPTFRLESLLGGIMERHGATCTPDEFHRAVNVTFHEFESELYDTEHGNMWGRLPRQFSLLVDDWSSRFPDVPPQIHLLDVGCGTGLASDSLIKTAIGGRIKFVTLLDTSPAMLRRASNRAAQWRIPFTCHHGTLDSLPPGTRYELIAACSVLHHIPDLAGFLATVRKLQAGHGVFLHLQDPNGDYQNDADLRARIGMLAKPLPEWAYRFTPKRILGRLWREWSGAQGQDLVSKTNRALIQRGILSTPLSPLELYAITDIHVNNGEGISLRRMESWLPDYECVARRSYGFFGAVDIPLPKRYQQIEQRLEAGGALNGWHIGAAWRLRPGS